MSGAESEQIRMDMKTISDKMTLCSEQAQNDSFLSFYANTPDFLHISGDGKMTNYAEFSRICTEYYSLLSQQKISTIAQKWSIIDTNLVISGWTGNIVARFKNGDQMNMSDYSITNVFKKIGGEWKIIHSHESSLPPVFVRNSP